MTAKDVDAAWFALARDFTYTGPHDRYAAHAIVAEHRPAIEAALALIRPAPARQRGPAPLLSEDAERALDEFVKWYPDAGVAAGLLTRIRSAAAVRPSPETTPAGVLDEAWEAAEKALPEGWVLDGYRRLYDEGHAAERWVARAVEPMRDDEKPDDWFLPLRVGEGPTPAAALLALAAALGRSGSGGGRG